MSTSTVSTAATTARRSTPGRPSPAPAPVLAGLCTLCTAAETCTFPRRPGEPVLQCEEATLPAPPVPSPFGMHGATRAEPDPQPRLTGLCSNCDHRDGCMLRKPEGGVWRCEEYA